MTNFYGPLSHRSGSDKTVVVDPRFGTSATPTQPTGWSAGGGGESTYSGGVRGEGFHVPPGSLDNLTTALVDHAGSRVEISYMGDSTGFGSGPDLAGGPPRKLRDLLLAAGLTDGGAGSMYMHGEFSISNTFSEGNKSYTWPPGGAGLMTNTVGEMLTVTGTGTAIRMWGIFMDRLTYSVDGGAAVRFPSPNSATHYISGLAPGSHTIVIKNEATAPNTLCGMFVEFLNTSGVVVHQDSVSGATSTAYTSYLRSKGSGSSGNTNTQYGLGMVQGQGGGPDWRSSPAARPQNRNVKAAIFALGLNDMSGITSDATADSEGSLVATKLSENAALFIRMCRGAQADPIIVVPHFESDSRGWRFAGRGRQALVTVAEAHGVAWCDYSTALRLAGIPEQDNPHLPQTSYDVEAQFLFDNVLSRALPEA